MGVFFAAVLFLPALMFGWRAVAAVVERKFELEVGSTAHVMKLERRPLQLGCLLLVHLVAVYVLAALGLAALWRMDAGWPELVCALSSAWNGFALWRVASIGQPTRREIMPMFIALLGSGRHALAAQRVAEAPDGSVPRLASAALGVLLPREAPRAYRSSGVGDVSAGGALRAIAPALKRERLRVAQWALSTVLATSAAFVAAFSSSAIGSLVALAAGLIAAGIALVLAERARRELGQTADELSAALAETARQRPSQL